MENFGDKCTIVAGERWEYLIQEFLRKCPDETPNLKKAIGENKVLAEVTENKDEAELVLKHAFGDIDIDQFYPFGFNFYQYRCVFRYIKESFAGRSQRRSSVENKTVKKFFVDPSYGNMDRTVLDNELKKIIRIFDPEKSKYLTHFYFLADKDNREYAYEAINVRKQLDLLGWKKYIEPSSDKSNVKQLCNILHASQGVEIWGDGGLGKTALAFEFIRRNLNHATHAGSEDSIMGIQEIPMFERIVFITSKSKEQGERPINFRVEKRGDPRDPRRTIAEYNPQGRFETFINRVSSLHPDKEAKGNMDAEKAAMDTLIKRRILVVIDNFEDIVRDTSNHKAYTRFLREIPQSSKSKVIVTSRPPATGDTRLTEFQIQRFDRQRIHELLVERIQWLVRTDPTRYSIPNNTVFNYILGRDFSELFEKIVEQLGNDFSKNMTSPSLLFVLARHMCERLAKNQTISGENQRTELPMLIKEIAESAELLEEILDVDRWMVNHAWKCLEDETYFLERHILLELYKRYEKIGSEELARLVCALDTVNIDDVTRNKIDRALKLLESHQLFLEIHDDGPNRSYTLTEKARRVLAPIEEFEGLEPEDTDSTLSGRLEKEKERLELLSEGINSSSREIIEMALDRLVGKQMDLEIDRKKDTKMDRRNKLDIGNLNRAVACRHALIGDGFSRMNDDAQLSALINKFDETVLNAVNIVLQKPERVDLKPGDIELGRLYISIAQNSRDLDWKKENLQYATEAIINGLKMNPTQSPDFLDIVPQIILSQEMLPQDGVFQ